MHARKGEESGEGEQREREREGRAVVLHILHSADVRGGHSSFPYTRSVGKKYGGLEANGRAEGGGRGGGGLPQPGHQFYTFCTAAVVGGCGGTARYACQDIF